jgi:hypothetical protein
MNPVQTFPSYFKSLLMLSSESCLGAHLIYSFKVPRQILYIYISLLSRTYSLITFSEEYLHETFHGAIFYSTIKFITFLRAVFPERTTKALHEMTLLFLFLEEGYRRAYSLFLKPLFQGFIYELPVLVSVLFMFI